MEAQKFNMDSKTLIKTLCCFAVIAVFWFMPPVGEITVIGMRVIGVFIGTILLLCLVDTLWPAFLGFILLNMTGVMTINQVLQGSMGSWIITFVIASFVLTAALNEVGFTQRLTGWFMTRKFVSKSPWMFVFAFWAISAIVGMFMDQVPATAFFLSFSAITLKQLGYSKDDSFSHMLTIGSVFAVNIGGASTPISHSLALLGMGIYEEATGNAISMFDYLAFGIPAGLVAFILMCVIFKLVFKADVSRIQNADINEIVGNREKMDLREKTVVTIFVIVVVMWVLPGLLEIFLGSENAVVAFLDNFSITFWAIAAVVALALIRINNEPLIDLRGTLQNNFAWGVIIFIAIGVVLGSAVSDEKVGLTEFISNNLAPMVSGLDPIIIVLIFAFVTTVMTNFSSNVTTITVMTGVAVVVAASIPTINPAAFALTTTMCGSLAFVLPSSFAPIAMLHMDENSNPGKVIKYGSVMVLVCTLTVTFIGYNLFALVM